MASTKKTVKQVTVVARIQFKADARKVVYLVRSSRAEDIYHTYLFDGKATSCECPSKKPCYHMAQVEAIEEARTTPVAVAMERAQAAMVDVEDKAFDLNARQRFYNWQQVQDEEQMASEYVAVANAASDSCVKCGARTKNTVCSRCLGC